MRWSLLLCLVGLVACSKSTCDQVNTAYLACVDELIAATGDPEAAIDEPIRDCSVYANPVLGSVADALGTPEVFSCQAAAWEDGDCTTTEGFGAATAAFNECGY